MNARENTKRHLGEPRAGRNESGLNMARARASGEERVVEIVRPKRAPWWTDHACCKEDG